MRKNKKPIYIYTGVIYFAVLCMSITNSILGPLLSNIMLHYSIELDGGGLMSLFQNIGGTLAIILLAFIMDKLYKQIAYILPILLLAVTMLLIGIVPPYTIFMVLFLFFGISLSTMDMISNAIIADVHQEKKDSALSLLHGIASGAFVAPLMAGTYVETGGPWQNTYTLMGSLFVLVLVVYVIVYIIAKKSLKNIRVQNPVKREKAIIKKFIKDKCIWVVIVCTFLFGGFQMGIVVWVSQYFKDAFGSGAIAAGLGLTAYWLGTGITRVLFGVTPLKKLKTRPVLINGSLFAGIVIIIGALIGNYFLMLACIFVAGCFNSPVLPRAVGLVTSWYKENSGLASSAVYASLYLGFSFSPLLMGTIANISGMRTLMFIPAICTILVGLIAFLLPKEETES